MKMAWFLQFITHLSQEIFHTIKNLKTMHFRTEITLPAMSRGFHLITNHVQNALKSCTNSGVLHVFISHTSAGLCINENADSLVLDDFDTFIDDLVPENYPKYTHTMEGSDDMPAHIKSVLTGSSVTVPVTNGRLDMGIWQGIYLCEFRNSGGGRRLVLSLL